MRNLPALEFGLTGFLHHSTKNQLPNIFGIDPGVGMVATKAPAVSGEDFYHLPPSNSGLAIASIQDPLWALYDNSFASIFWIVMKKLINLTLKYTIFRGRWKKSKDQRKWYLMICFGTFYTDTVWTVNNVQGETHCATLSQNGNSDSEIPKSRTMDFSHNLCIKSSLGSWIFMM